MEYETSMIHAEVLKEVKEDAKKEAKRQRISLGRYIENLIKKDLAKQSMSEPFEKPDGDILHVTNPI